MRVAFFGGTFDPPHRGHVAIAQAAADAFELDRVLFAPAGRQPLKDGHATLDFGDRLALSTMACASDERFAASALDAPREDGQPNYTVDVLTELRRQMPDATIFNLVGADSFNDLGRWREPAELLRLAEWIVVSRPGHVLDEPEGYPLTAGQRARVHLLDAVHLDISATELRARLAAGELCDDLLTAPVAGFIRAHGFYRHEL
ncbi:nicotinate-nucleotide adenylyltransferase [Granulicella rosea]|uniref:Probable nicotinate-nucleotide adenylyltransferase n=1 Tax=Granulicella rosea TaxID=474952 RepID=A0A239LUV7_9BACT|nr:nicotinate-nucleotide adenylyltransferase [Granulicella rosea]SNT33489.1 nicotinate-nucleotide adenylyltransferase [Granulicella rosea]